MSFFLTSGAFSVTFSSSGKQLAKIQKLEAKQKTKLIKALSRKETGFLEELSRGVWLGWEGACERV